VVALVASGISATARALEIEFAEPAPCNVEEVSFRVERALARPLGNIDGPRFRVNIERNPGGFLGRVDISPIGTAATPGQRRLVASSCDELIDTLALTIVLAVGPRPEAQAASDERALLRSTEPEQTPSPAALATAEMPAAEPARTEPSPQRTAGPRVGAFGAMVGDTGSLPALSVGIALGFSVAWPAVEFRALGTFLPSKEGFVAPSDPASPGAEIGLVTAGVLACMPFATNAAAVALSACAGWELGRLSGRGTGVDVSRSSTALWSAARADLGARWAFPGHWLGLELALTAVAPISQDEFVLRDIGSVHEPANVVGRASLGLRIDLGP